MKLPYKLLVLLLCLALTISCLASCGHKNESGTTGDEPAGSTADPAGTDPGPALPGEAELESTAPRSGEEPDVSPEEDEPAPGKPDDQPEGDVPAQAEEGGAPTASGWAPEVAQRQSLLDAGSACGVVYMGYVDPAADDLDSWRSYYESLFRDGGYLDTYAFLADIPASSFATTGGEELFLIIPADAGASVSVSHTVYDTEYHASQGETLYSGGGAPFLLKCNVSDIYPDSQVLISGSGGSTTVVPMISLMDGRAYCYAEGGSVYDLSTYPAGA